MRVLQQVLTPGMQKGEEAHFPAEALRVTAQREQGFRGGLKQEVVDNRLVLKGDFGGFLWDREDHVEILDRQQVGFAVFDPLPARRVLTLRAMAIPAGIVGDMKVIALAALFDMTAECRRAADLDRTQHAKLLVRQRMSLTVGLAVLSNNVGQLESGPAHHGLFVRLRLRLRRVEAVERPGRAADQLGRHGGVAGRGGDLTMPEQDLDDTNIGSVLQQIRGKTVSK